MRLGDLADDPKEARSETARAAQVARPTRRNTWIVFGLPVFLLFQAGVIIGAFSAGAWSKPDERQGTAANAAPLEENIHLPQPAGPAASAPEQPEPVVRSGLEAVDRLLRAGRCEQAVSLSNAAASSSVANLRASFQYRAALGLEALGHWEDALEAYRAVASHSTVASLNAAAQLGQARACLGLRRTEASKSLLCELLLRMSDPDLRGLPVLADARFLRALIVAREVLGDCKPGPMSDEPFSHVSIDCPLDDALSWVQPSGQRPESAPHVVGEKIAVRRTGPIAGEFMVHISVSQTPLEIVLQRLAEQCGLRLEWSPAVERQVAGREVLMAVDNLALADCLDALAEVLGLSWALRDGALQIGAAPEAAPAGASPERLARARRYLQQAVLISPGHSLAAAAYLTLGNIAVAAGQPDEAVAWYRRLGREFPRSSLLAGSQYNLGLFHVAHGDNSAAREAFFRVVDRAPANELTPLSYWRIGRTFLEDAEPEQAVSPLRRAIGCSSGLPVQAAAAVSLSCAYLLAGNPRAANSVLFDHRNQVSQPDFRAAAAFLDALARYRAKGDPRRQQRAANELMTSLLTLGNDPLLDSSGFVLRSQAYQELGMVDAMRKLLEDGRTRMRGRMAGELTFSLAEAYFAGDQREKALPLYQTLAKARASPHAAHCRLRLAEMAMQSDKPVECLKWCREVLKDRDGLDVATVLKLMAQAYERSGDRDAAIRCLSGELPE